MNNDSKARVMRDRDGLGEQNWSRPGAGQPASGQPYDDPLAELARIVGPGAAVPPTQRNAPSIQDLARDLASLQQPRRGAPQPAAQPAQPEWAEELEQVFAGGGQLARASHAQQPAAQQPNPPMPEWLRSPAVRGGQGNGGRVPRQQQYNTPAYHEDDGYGAAPQGHVRGVPAHDSYGEGDYAASASYHAQDPYQLAAQGRIQQDEPAPHNRQDGYDDQYGYSEQTGYDDGLGSFYQDDNQPPRRRISRGLMVAGVVVGLGVVAVAGTLLFKGEDSGSAGGAPPVISADGTPVKVEPENPGGVEVPNTNRAIYEHTNQTASGEGSVVVDNREQPVDINQMLLEQESARAQAAAEQAANADAINTSTSGAAGVALPEAPAPTSPATLTLGEPKRVRTVSVRPDGTILPTSPDPVTENAAPAANEQAGMTQSTSAQEATATPAAVPVPVPRPTVIERPATRAPLQITPQAVNQPQQIAAAASAGVPGSFTVQLAAPGSENEARNLFSSLQGRYSELAGRSPVIVRAESGGRTIYRLRVGAFGSRDEASALCVRIQAQGGQCFVARN